VSLIEGISRDILAKDGCGVADAAGVNLNPEKLTEPLKRFEAAKQKAGGNRFVDELDFHEVHEALKGHESWCQFFARETGFEEPIRQALFVHHTPERCDAWADHLPNLCAVQETTENC
jgi:hypothetical protein